ncbi:hypothetical protein CLV98_10733 [Dyadobacter jejuensis]|uniref:Lipocalin-like domain-containing protein n=1 Tax=Dyadobacter jejuensis TaxID=1082580 RepID=A0A316AHY7_9BACT|nr:hypothetical protein [Dyadobacter jejuensis]PWJ57326.1 hypothetical protein CLV98_10733 [Dyadobacter jejuensis]
MKKILFCCLVLLMGACKDKNNEPEPDPDYSTEFVGQYGTTTAKDGISTVQTWDVSRVDKNLLGIKYTVAYTITAPGKVFTSTDIYNLDKVVVIDALNFRIDQQALYTDDGFEKIRTVQGDGVKIRDANGDIKLGITMNLIDQDGSSQSSGYLEFKKK